MISIDQLRKMLREGNFNGTSKPESAARENPPEGSEEPNEHRPVGNRYGPKPKKISKKVKKASPPKKTGRDRFGTVMKRIGMEMPGAGAWIKVYILTMYEQTGVRTKYDVVAHYGKKDSTLKQFIIDKGRSRGTANVVFRNKLNEKIDKGYKVVSMEGV